MVLRYLLLISVLLTAVTLSFSQKVWTVEECIAFGIEHNLQLNEFQFNTASSNENAKQSIRAMLPNLSANAEYGISYGRSVNPNTNDIITTEFSSSNYSLNASVTLFNGFQRLNTIKASQLIRKASAEEQKQEEYLLSFRIMTAYYQVQFLQKLLQIAEQQHDLAKQNYALVEKQIEIGIKASSDVYEAKAILAADELKLTQQQNKLALAKLELIQQMNLEGSTEIEIVVDEHQMLEGKKELAGVDSIFKRSQQFLPLLKAQEYRIQSAQKRLKTTRGTLYPSLSAFAAYGTGYFETNVDNETGRIIPFRRQLKDNASTFIGLSLNIPISNRWASRSAIRLEKIQLRRVENQKRIAEQEVIQNIQQLLQTNKALQITLKQSLLQMENREKTFEIAQRRYQKGLINALELTQAKVAYTNAQNENLQVEMNALINKSTLDFYKGIIKTNQRN